MKGRYVGANHSKEAVDAPLCVFIHLISSYNKCLTVGTVLSGQRAALHVLHALHVPFFRRTHHSDMRLQF